MPEENKKIKSLLSFIKYHNAVPLVAMVVFLGASATLAASPVARDAISDAVIQKKETIISIDNSRIVSANLENFNPELQIREVTEDDEKYYVRYAFTNIILKDYVWQDMAEERVLSIAKTELSGKDLGLRVAKELGEVLEYESGFLKEVQAKEKKKGTTKKVATVEYAGLVGKFLDPEQKEFDGYAPVVPEPETPPEASAVSGQLPSTVTTASLPPTRDEIRAFVAEEVARLLNEALAARNAPITQEQSAPVVNESQISTTADTTTNTATTTDLTTVATTTSTADTTTSTTTDSGTTSTTTDTTTSTATTTETTTGI